MRKGCFFPLAIAALLASTACARGAAAPDAAIVEDCANPELPPEILDGPIAPAAAPLRVVTASAGALKLRLAVAADGPNQELGLMCVLKLRPRHGMIFVFDSNAGHEFWMKNTLVPLDMVWAGDDGTITTIAANVPASTRATADGSIARRFGRGRFVIELRAGEAAADKLAVGTRLMLPPLRADLP
jgi:hypothetical protein